MAKMLIEFEYNEKTYPPEDIVTEISVLACVGKVRRYKNFDELSVDESSKQCGECPARFVQEG